MGKGARSREKNVDKKIKRAEENVKEVKKAKWGKFWTIIVSLFLVVVVAATMLIYNFYYANASYLRNNIVMESENIQIDNAMMTYNFRNEYNTYLGQMYNSYSGYTGVDTTRSLKVQDYSADATWFDYFLDLTIGTTEDMLVWAEEAMANGVSLNEEELQSIQDLVDVSLTSFFFENGIVKEDITKAMEVARLASKYITQIQDEAEFTQEELEEHYQANTLVYDKISYKSYTLFYGDEGEMNQEEADLLSIDFENAATPEEFDELIIKSEQTGNDGEDNGYAEALIESSLVENKNYDATNQFIAWAFEEGREQYETHYTHDSDSKSYTFYMLTELPGKDEEQTLGFKHILIEKLEDDTVEEIHAKAQEVLDEWNAQGSTDEAFTNLVLQYSDDLGSNLTGGLYEGVVEGELEETIDEWVFDDAREVGEAELVDSDYGTHIVVFLGETGQDWEYTVSEDLKLDLIETLSEEYIAKYPITINENAMNDIPE